MSTEVPTSTKRLSQEIKDEVIPKVEAVKEGSGAKIRGFLRKHGNEKNGALPKEIEGNILLLPKYTLEVVAACSGLRSLMTMVTLAVIITAFMDYSIIKKGFLVACSLPIAVVANTFRLVITALGAYIVDARFADGFLHEISGLIVFTTGFLLLIIINGILKWKK
jgi:exosortase